MGQEPLKWILARPIDVPWVVSDQKSPKKKVQKMGQKVKIQADFSFLVGGGGGGSECPRSAPITQYDA